MSHLKPKQIMSLFLICVCLVLCCASIIMWSIVAHGHDDPPFVVPITVGAITGSVLTLCFIKHF